MTMHTIETKRSNHFIPNFEVCSVLLFAALSMGAAASAQAQTSTALPATHHNQPSQVALSGATGAIPPNKTTGKELDAAFTRADTDRDGQLSHQEGEHFPVLAPRFKQIDSNGNGFISRDEFNRAATR